MNEEKLNQIINKELIVDNEEELWWLLDNGYDDLSYVSNRLRNDYEIMKKACYRFPYLYGYMNDRFKDDKLFLIDILYFIVPFIKFNNSNAQEEIDKVNIFKADLGHWKGETPLANNIHCIIFLTIMTLSIIFFIAGLIRHIKRKNQNKV